MARTAVVWTGLNEYREQLRAMPQACTREAATMVEGAVNSAFVTISAVYGAHRHTGTLQRRLKIMPLRFRGELTTGLELRSGSPIAWLFDNGSQARHHASGKSTGTMWGRTPPTHIFKKTVVQKRREMVMRLKDMVLRYYGVTSVTGE